MSHMVIATGQLGRNPELKFLPDGTPLCEFSLACNDGFGEHRKTTWFEVVTYKAMAENCHKYLHKGAMVKVTGTVSVNAYLSRDKQEAKASLRLSARDVEFLVTDKDKQQASDEDDNNASDIPF